MTQGGVGEDRLVAGRDYPRTWPEFERFLVDEETCLRYLERLRWRAGFSCPVCGHGEAWRTRRGLWVCRACERQTAVTGGDDLRVDAYAVADLVCRDLVVGVGQTGDVGDAAQAGDGVRLL